MAAEIIPIDRSDKELVKEEYTEAIRLWCQSRDTADILSREEIGALQGFKRIDAQRKAIILNLVHYYRKHERADVAPGLAVVITLLSDNDKGAASISQPTLAKLFGRSLSSIGDAIRRLKEDGIIVTGRGRFPLTHPVIPREVTRHQNHLVWLIDGACQSAQPLNLPVPSGDCQTTGPVRGLSQSTGPTGDLKKLNPPVEPISIHRGDRCQIHYKNSAAADEARERESFQPTPLKIAATIALGVMAATSTGLPAAAKPVEPHPMSKPAKPSIEGMRQQMMDAAGNAIRNPAACPGLIGYSEIKRWLDDGCDFEIDVLPTIQAVSARNIERGYELITSWSYFTTAIARAKATRLAPMPEAKPLPSKFKSHADQETERVSKFLAACRSPSNGSST